MKRILTALLLALCLCMACASAEKALPGAALSGVMDDLLTMVGSELMQNRHCMALLPEELEMRERLVGEVLAGDYAAPARAYAVDLHTADDGAPLLPNFVAGDLYSAVHGVHWEARDKEADPWQTESRVDSLMRSATVDRFYPCDMEDGAGLVLLLYERGTPVLMTWQADGGVVLLQAGFIRSAELAACDTADEVADWLAACGRPGLPVTALSWDAQGGSDAYDASAGEKPIDPAQAIALAQKMGRAWLEAVEGSELQAEMPYAMLSDYAQAPRMILTADPTRSIEVRAAQTTSMHESETVQRALTRSSAVTSVVYLMQLTEADMMQSVSMLNMLCPRTATYADAQARDCGLMLLLYEDALPVAVLWWAENGAVHLQGFFVEPAEELLQCRTAADVTMYFFMTGRGLASMQFEELAP